MKKQSAKDVAKLMDQYPAVRKLHEYTVRKGADPATVTIRVQRADTSLMFRQADNAEGDGHYVCREDGQDGTRNEYAYTVSDNDRLWTRMSWGVFDRRYVKDLFNKHVPFRRVAYIIWTTHYDWYEKITDAEKEQGVHHGAHSEWEVHYTIYLPPDEGFEALYKRSDVTKNVVLTERSLTNGVINEEEPFILASQRLSGLAKEFEQKVFANGLGKIIDDSRKKGMSGLFDGVSLMSWVMCGRLMMTFQAPNLNDPELRDSFTIIGNEHPTTPMFGYRSIYTTVDRATELVRRVISVWNNTPAEELVKMFRDDKNVGLG
jgi:hypothetical protein